MSTRILVTGANGFIGSVVCMTLQTHGIVVRGASRSADLNLPGVEGVRADLLAPQTLPPLVEGCDIVIHLAGAAHGKLGRSADLAAFRKINTQASIDLASAALAAGVRRFVFVSTIGVHGSLAGDTALTEASPEAPDTPYGQSKCEAEHELRALLEETSMDLCIVRPPLVYGPGAAGNFGLLLKLAARGVPLPLASVRNRRSLIAVANLADFLVCCAFHPAAAGQSFLVSDGDDVSTPEILQHLARGMNRRASLFAVPQALLQLGARLLGRQAMMRQLTGSLWIDASKIADLLGWQAPGSAAAALEAAGRAYVKADIR